MPESTTTVEWRRNGAPFLDSRYSRAHRWIFDGGLSIPASSSPQVVAVPMSDTSAVDPEEAFIASLSSCHMLWFLSIAAKKGYVVDSYLDHVCGIMGKDVEGRMAMIRVTLRPQVEIVGTNQPEAGELRAMHHAAHENCFIANSVKTEVVCEPRLCTLEDR